MRHFLFPALIFSLLMVVSTFAHADNSSGTDSSSSSAANAPPSSAGSSQPESAAGSQPAVTAGPQAGPKAPEEAEILLPEMILNIEDISTQSVSSVLPPSSELAIPKTTTPLPDQGDLHIPDSAFNVTTPDQGMAPSSHPSSATLFSTGVLGAGTSDHILGSVSLYKLGNSPRFRLGFSHESLDGFDGQKAGTGFFTQTNAIDGWLNIGDDNRTSLQTQGSFNENEEGLQNTSTFYSAKVQTLGGEANLTLHPDPLLAVGSIVDAGLATRLFSVSAASTGGSVSQSEYHLAPELFAALNLPTFNAELKGNYDLRMTDGLPTVQSLAAGVSIDASLPSTLVLKVNGGINWPVGGALQYPFGIDFSGTLFQALTLTVSGGYSITPQRLATLWPQFPILAAASTSGLPLSDASSWFGKFAFTWNTADQIFSADGGVGIAYRENVVNILGYSGGSSSVYRYELDSMLTLTPSLRLRWNPLPQFALNLGWNANLLNKVTQEAWNTFSLDLELNNLANRVGGSLTGSLNLYDSLALPTLNASGYFDVSDGVRFTLDVSDFLSPFLSNGRAEIGASPSSAFPFLKPGFRVTVSTHISL